MQLTKTTFLDSATFIEKKRIENRMWRKSAFCGEKVNNAGEKKLIHPVNLKFEKAFVAITESMLVA
jgi:hypothetical protein